MPDPLAQDDLQQALTDLPEWTLVEGRLHRELRFADFNEAFSFMVRVALVAEKRNHHPDWSNSWNRVVIDLVSHDAGGVTQRDVDFAQVVDGLVR